MDETQVLSTNTSFTPYTTISPSSLVLISQEILFAIVCFVGLLGNTLVIYVVIRFSKMQTVTNMYIVNLAIADECFLIGIPFLIVTMVKTSWIFGEVMCKVNYPTIGEPHCIGTCCSHFSFIQQITITFVQSV